MTPFFENEVNLARLRSVASDWLGTPFMPNAAVKKSGVSCQKLVGAIYIEAGFLPATFSVPDGPMDWSAAQKDSLVAKFLDGRPEFETQPSSAPFYDLMPGDVVGFKIGGCVHHCGLLLYENGTFIHCLRNRGTIQSSLRDATYFGRIDRIWRPQTVSGLNIPKETP